MSATEERFDVDRVVALARRRFKPKVALTLEVIIRHSGFSWRTRIHSRLPAVRLAKLREFSVFTAQAHLNILRRAGVMVVNNPERRARSAYQYRLDVVALRALPVRPLTRRERAAKRQAALAKKQAAEDSAAKNQATNAQALNNQDASLIEKPLNETGSGPDGVGEGAPRRRQAGPLSPFAWLAKYYPGLKWPKGFGATYATWTESGFDPDLIWWAMTRACAAAKAKGAKHPELALAWWILKAPTEKDWHKALELATKEGRAKNGADPKGKAPDLAQGAAEAPENTNAPTAGISAAQAAFAAAKAKRAKAPKRRKRAKKANPGAEATKAVVAAINAAGLPTDHDPFAAKRGRYHAYYAQRRSAQQPGYRVGAGHKKKLDAAEDHLLRSRIPEAFWPELFDEMERFWEFVTRDRERASYPAPDMPCNNSFIENWIGENKPPLRFTPESVKAKLATNTMLAGLADRPSLFALVSSGLEERVGGQRLRTMEYVLVKRSWAKTRKEAEPGHLVEAAINFLAEHHWDLEVAGGDR